MLSLSTGHVFNMPHDNVKACEEVFGKLKDNHMMSPTLIQINRTSPWSPCSAAIITDFLDSGHGKPAQPLFCQHFVDFFYHGRGGIAIVTFIDLQPRTILALQSLGLRARQKKFKITRSSGRCSCTVPSSDKWMWKKKNFMHQPSFVLSFLKRGRHELGGVISTMNVV